MTHPTETPGGPSSTLVERLRARASLWDGQCAAVVESHVFANFTAMLREAADRIVALEKVAEAARTCLPHIEALMPAIPSTPRLRDWNDAAYELLVALRALDAAEGPGEPHDP